MIRKIVDAGEDIYSVNLAEPSLEDIYFALTAGRRNDDMKAAMYAIIKKDFRGVANNRRLFSALLIVPLVLTVIFPSIFVITITLYQMIRLLRN